MIRPPFEERANAVTARSISPASRTPTGLSSTPNDGATAMIAPNCPMPPGIGGIPQYRRSRHARRDLLEQPQPFPAHAVFEQAETSGVAARPRQALDDSQRRPDRLIATNTIGIGAVGLQQLPQAPAASGQDDVGRERDQFRHAFANALGIARGPAVVDPHVAPIGPAQLLRAPARMPRGGTCPSASSASQVHEHADAPHPLALLRPRRERPRRRAAEQRDELAPFCMTRKEHCEGRRGAGHDRTRVATGSPQPFRIPNRE